jgi:pimeloyl-ACP methyl ester carboxylesterase
MSPVKAFYFNSGGHNLFGWLHEPADGIARDLGFIICNPFGQEADCAHLSMRAFADTAAAAGIPTLRFDYLGTGDSADIDPRANQLEVWSKDVVAAVDELKRVAGVERVCLLGVRLGAVLATMAAAQSRSVAGLALISPIIDGRRYVRELRVAQLAGLKSSEPPENPAYKTQEIRDGSMEVGGYLLSAATVAALTEVDLTRQEAQNLELLIIDGDTLPVARRWAEALSVGNARAQYRTLPGLIEMVMRSPHLAVTSAAMLIAVRDWLQIIPIRADAEVGGRSLGCATLPTSTILELPGDHSRADGRIREQPVFFLSDPKVFGILTIPCQDEMRQNAVILLNSGAISHTGPSRLYVSLARRWARCGYLVIRMDLAGLGDSEARTGRPENEVFPPAAVDDIRAAIAFLQVNYRIERVTLCGLCSGAYHALQAAIARLPLNGIFLVNPQNFFWKEGSDISALQPADVFLRIHRHRERIFSMTAWKRLLTGQVNIWSIVRIYLQRPLLAVELRVRDLARHLRFRLPRDLGWRLKEIASHGVRVIFVFGRGEAGIDLLRIHAGSSVQRLKGQCGIHVIDNVDHIFSKASQRATLETLLSDELFALDTVQTGSVKSSIRTHEPHRPAIAPRELGL